MRVVRENSLNKSREKRLILGDPILADPYQHMMLLGNPIPTSAAVVKKDLLLMHQGMSEDRDLISMEDFDCWLRLAKAGARFYFLNQCLGSYWVGIDAISAVSPRQIEVQKLLYQRNAPKENSTFRMQALGRQNYVLGSLYLRLGNPYLAFEHLKVAGTLGTLGLISKRWLLIMLSLVKMTGTKFKLFISNGD